MLRLNRMFTLLLLVALILSACQPIQAMSPILTGVPHQARPDAPPYAARGTYAVGVRDFVIETPDRPIPVSVWYPALNPNTKTEAVTYALGFPTNEFPEFTVAGRALRDAQPDYSNGPYPLLLHIHAAWSLRQEMAYLVEHLASHGFVVIAPAMTDNWGMLFSSVYPSEIVRPRDASRTLDFAEELTASGGQLEGLIDLEHIAASGWSWGGQTVLELAGARIDLNDWLATYCKMYPEDGDCVTYPDHLADMATLAGLDAAPEGLWPDWRDPRIDAIVPFAPGVSMFTDEGIQNVKIPVLVILGSADNSVGPMFAMRHTDEKLPTEAKTRIIFENAGHLLYFNNCTAVPALSNPDYSWVCSDPVWDMDRAHDLINHFVTAFLLAELKGDTEAAKALAPENVTFPGIQYETTTYGANAAVPIQSASGFAEVNGTRLYYETAGTGEPIVMIHGLGWDTRDWDAQFAEFAKQYQVVRYDMRGFGKSDMPTDQPYSHADDLKALLDYLGTEPAHLFGHSFGGEIAINFALAYPEATRSLVLIEPDIQGAQGLPALTPEEEASFATAFAALEKGDRVGAALAIVNIHPLVTVSKGVPGVRELILSAFTDYQWFQFLNEDPVVQPEIPSAERIGEITAPTLLVVGDSTTEFQKIEVDRLAEQLSNAEKGVFENSDHFPHLLYPEKFNALVLDFLAKTAGQQR